MKFLQVPFFLTFITASAYSQTIKADNCDIMLLNTQFDHDTSSWQRLGNHSSAFQYDNNSQSAKLIRQSTSNDWAFQGAFQNVSTSINSGQSYTLHLTHRVNQASDLKVWARLNSGTVMEIKPSNVSSWQMETFTLEAGSGSNKIELYTTHGNGGDTYLFDNVSLTIPGCTVEPPTDPIEIGYIAEGISLDELMLQRQRIPDNGVINDQIYAPLENQLEEWNRISGFTDTLMTDHANVINANQSPQSGSSDYRLNFWNGPVAGYTSGSNSHYWDGLGLIPKQAQATLTTSSGKSCVASSYNCQDAFHISDNLLAASYYALIKNDASVRNVVKKALLRQTNIELAPGVDFSDRTRWPVNNDAAHQNPFFFTASWTTKIARMYDYTKYSVDIDGNISDNVYSDTEKQQIESWLYNAGEYFREVVEHLIINQFYNHPKANSGETPAQTFANNVSHRINQNPLRGSSGVDRPQYSNSSYRYWDNGPLPTGSQLQLQNRITDTATAFCVIGFIVDDDTMKRDCKLFFKEVIAYGMDADGHLGDFYRAKSRGGYEAGEEMGVHYVVGQLAHLIEIADLFARTGDNSLYEYQTSEGAEVSQHGQLSSTKGGPKSLYLGLTRTSQFLKNKGVVYNQSLVTEANHVINGVTAMQSGADIIDRYMQHQMTWAQGNVYYQRQELADAIYSDTSKGYHGWKVWWKTINNGYISHTTRGTFGVSVGQQLLYGKMEGRVWPYPNINEQTVKDTLR